MAGRSFLKNRPPNLFIVGAPKCGTSALSYYLACHPDVFMSEKVGIKEPDFYSVDRDIPWRPVTSAADYEAIFSRAPSDARYLGEASTSYLESHVAIPNLLHDSPDARLIVMVRNPLDLVQALHNQRLKRGKEISSFSRAWELQQARNEGRELPRGVGFSNGDMLQYGRIAKMGEQLDRLYRTASNERIHVIVYDDFVASPGNEYARLLEWLGLRWDGRQRFPVVNPRQEFRSPRLEKLLQYLRRIRTRVGIPGGLGVHALINRFNGVEKRSPLDPDLRTRLCEYFVEDVALLSDLLGRDLSGWLRSLKSEMP